MSKYRVARCIVWLVATLLGSALWALYAWACLFDCWLGAFLTVLTVVALAFGLAVVTLADKPGDDPWNKR